MISTVNFVLALGFSTRGPEGRIFLIIFIYFLLNSLLFNNTLINL